MIQETYKVNSDAGELVVEYVGAVTEDVTGEEYSAGYVNGELAVWAPEVGVPTSMVLVDYLHESWQHPEADVEKFADKVRAFVK